MSKRNRKKVSDLEARIDAHPGTPVLQSFQWCEIAKDAFEVSALEVRRLLLALENPNRQPENRSHGVMQNSGESFKEVLRRLLHFLASADSLVRRTEETVQRDFIAEGLRLAHKEAVTSTFLRPPAACFMRDLQAYMRNRTALPMMETRYTVPRPKYIEVFIDAADMLHWAKWTSPARGFLHRFLSKLPVLRIVDDHVERTRTFYHRFVRFLREHRGEDMEAAKALMEELNGPPSCLPPILRFP